MLRSEESISWLASSLVHGLRLSDDDLLQKFSNLEVKEGPLRPLKLLALSSQTTILLFCSW